MERKIRKYDASVSIGRLFRTVQYESGYRKGSRANLFALMRAYEAKYHEKWDWGTGIRIHEINVVG